MKQIENYILLESDTCYEVFEIRQLSTVTYAYLFLLKCTCTCLSCFSIHIIRHPAFIRPVLFRFNQVFFYILITSYSNSNSFTNAHIHVLQVGNDLNS